MSIRRSFTSPLSSSQSQSTIATNTQTRKHDDDDQQIFQQVNYVPTTIVSTSSSQLPQQNSTEVNSRPLSLYDNLTALVANLKPPNSDNLNQSIEQNGEILNGIHSGNKLNGSSTSAAGNDDDTIIRLLKVNQDDFIFSDLKFEFPELSPATSQSRLNQNYTLVNSVVDKISRNKNNSNDSDLNRLMSELLNDVNQRKQQIMMPSLDDKPPPRPPRTIPPQTPQYVNIDESMLKQKPAISDAKSTFFGLSTNEDVEDNDSSLKPLIEQQTQNHHHHNNNNNNHHHHGRLNVFHHNSPPPTTSSHPSHANYHRLMANDNYPTNNNPINECNTNDGMTNDERISSSPESGGTTSTVPVTASLYDKFRNSRTESPHKSVTYDPTTEDYGGYDNKPSQVRLIHLN